MTACVPLVAWAAFVALHTLLSGRAWWWGIPELVPPIVFVAVPPAAGAVAVLGGTGPAAVSAAVLLLVAGAPWSGLVLPRSCGSHGTGGGAPVGPPLRVFVWNTEFWGQGQDPAAFASFLRRQHADVYLLQEYLHRVDGRVVPAAGRVDAAAALPEHEVFVDGELVTAARGRLAPRRRDGVPGVALRVDVGDVEDPIAFYNIHVPVQLDPQQRPLQREFYRSMHVMMRRQRRTFRSVADLLDGGPARFVAGGDFNSSPAARAMRRLRRGRRDVARWAGRVYPTTWRRLWRIDWVLTSRHVRVEWARLVDPEGRSDHSGQLSGLRL